MVSFYADENFDYDVVQHLRALGYDVLTAVEDGRGGRKIPDENVLARAIQLTRAVLTFNRDDFRRLHRLNSNHTGIVTCTLDQDRTALAERIAGAVGTSDSLPGQLLRIVRPNKR